MADAICDTSPLQYLHQLEIHEVLPTLVGRIIVPHAVLDELAAGRAFGLNLPDPQRLDWVVIKEPSSAQVLTLVTGLGPGETAVLALALEHPGTPVILDDAQARRTARRLRIGLTGTLGILVSAKHAHLISDVTTYVDRLQSLGFRLDTDTRCHVLDLAGESIE